MMGEGGSAQLIAGRRCYSAQYSGNSPCEDVCRADALRDGVLVLCCDGHGGRQCADFAADIVPRLFREAGAAGDSAAHIEQQLSGAFEQTDDRWLTEFASASLADTRAGSCALACFCDAGHAVVANAGDCRAVLGRQAAECGPYVALPLSTDHTAKNAAEVVAVTALTSDPLPFRTNSRSNRSALPCTGPPARVGGSLIVTRALGDGYLKLEAVNNYLQNSSEIFMAGDFLPACLRA
jgi:serine/threonine protein phosphatase PrpC